MAATKTPKSRKNDPKKLPKSPRAKAITKPKRKGPGTEKEKPRPRAHASRVLLTTRERRQLLKPRPDFAEIMQQIEKTWGELRALKVPALNTRGLRVLREKALRAVQREAEMREEYEKKLRVFSDARLIAEDAAYRAILTVYAAVKLYRISNVEIGKRFAFIGAHLTAARVAAEHGR